MSRTAGGRAGRLLVVLASTTIAACASTDADGWPDLAGASVEVLTVWQDAEAAAFDRVLTGFEQRTGATITLTSTSGDAMAVVLGQRLEAGDPPDVALVPQPGLVAELAQRGVLVPIDSLVGERVAHDWAPVWQRLGTVDGELVALWFKASDKSLIWYSIGRFEDAGLVPPSDLDGLAAVVAALTEHSGPPLSLTGAANDAWTLTDWFENLYLRLAGPQAYDALAERRIPWTHESVARTLDAMAGLLAAEHVLRAAGAETTFPESVAAVFAPDASASLVMEGDFAPGVVAGGTSAQLGIHVDVFPFPGVEPTDRLVVAGGDAAVLLRDSEAARTLIRYLATPDSATIWAALGGFLSPNQSVPLTAYPDATTRRIARSLLEAGDGLRFDLSDLQPAAFGATPGAGMWAELTRFVEDPRDVEAAMARLEEAASDAWGDG